MKSVLMFLDDIYEDLELWYPKLRLEEAGHKVICVGEEKGKTYIGKHGYPCISDESFKNIDPNNWNALIIPGGYAPDKMRRNENALEIIRSFDQKKKLIAFICHAGWMLCSAQILKGRIVTGTTAIKDDLENAGAQFKDEALVIDRNFISSRTPKDLPVFGRAIVENLVH